MHEIITLQCGRSANYVATHFWNAQDRYQSSDAPADVDHNVHFRAGLAADGTETYLPRTLIYDLRGQFGSLARVNVLGSLEDHAAGSGTSEEELSLWNGPLSRISAATQAKPSPYSLSLLGSGVPVAPTPATTPFFADFATTYFHPRSLQPLAPPHPQLDPGASPADASLPEFTSFGHGTRLFSVRDKADDILDNELRPWIEEADQLQALQLFASLSDAWAGFAASYTEAVRDELPKACLWVWGFDDLQAKQGVKARWEQALNRTQALVSLEGSASVVVPLAVPRTLPPSVSLQRDVLWHTSALLCAGIESAGLPTRLNDSGALLSHWDALLSEGGRRKIASLKYGVMQEKAAMTTAPRDARVRESNNDPKPADSELDRDLDLDLFPHDIAAPMGPKGRRLGRRATTFSRIDTIRRTAKDPGQSRDSDYDMGRSGFNEPIVKQYNSTIELPLPLTFPRIFTSSNSRTASVPVHACLSTTSTTATWLRSLAAPLGSGSASALSLPLDVPDEEREALRARLLEMADSYVADWESGSESEGMDEN